MVILVWYSSSDWPMHGAEPGWRHSREGLGSGCWARALPSCGRLSCLGSWVRGCSFSLPGASVRGQEEIQGWGAGCTREWGSPVQPARALGGRGKVLTVSLDQLAGKSQDLRNLAHSGEGMASGHCFYTARQIFCHLDPLPLSRRPSFESPMWLPRSPET